MTDDAETYVAGSVVPEEAEVLEHRAETSAGYREKKELKSYYRGRVFFDK